MSAFPETPQDVAVELSFDSLEDKLTAHNSMNVKENDALGCAADKFSCQRLQSEDRSLASESKVIPGDDPRRAGQVSVRAARTVSELSDRNLYKVFVRKERMDEWTD